MSHQITITIPEALYRQLAAEAKQGERSLEAIMVERLALRPLNLQQSDDELLIAMRDFGIEQLWAAVEQHLTPAEAARYAVLSAKNKTEDLNPSEETELNVYLETLDRYSLLRAEALLLLKERGEDIEAYRQRVQHDFQNS